MHEKIEFNGWQNCLRIYNDEIEVIVATDIGIRILRAGFINGQNFLYLSPDDAGKIGGSDWRIYGGHRLWHAPEAIPRSYAPDNSPVEYSIKGNTLTLTQAKEASTGIIKEVEISLHASKNEVTVVHRLINKNLWAIRVSPWAISALDKGGTAIIPQEPYGEGDEFLLPSRPLVLWQYTQMQDPRWFWGNKYILANQDTEHTSEQKIGVLNKEGWVAYHLNKEILIKTFVNRTGDYPDYNSNNEIYINENFLEIETLGPLEAVGADSVLEHTEYWLLAKTDFTSSEEAIDSNVLPLVNSFMAESSKNLRP
jgi:hypothetical protein